MGQALPVAHFSTQDLPPAERYDAWRGLVSAVFEPRPVEPTRGDLRVRTRSVHLGHALVVSVDAEAQHFIRSRHLIAREGLDHYMLQVYRHGVCDGTYGELQNTVQPGDIKVVDLGRTFHTVNTAFDNISLAVPRAALAPLIAEPDRLHGVVLRHDTAVAQVLGSHLRQLADHGADLSASQGASLGAATARLVAACLGASPRARDETRAQREFAAGQSVRDFINQNLAAPALDPDMLARRFRLSRAQLYRLFPDDGGVATYIRARRLRACFQALANPVHRAEGIGAIALRHGFASEAHFCRAFRAAFGMTPSEARACAFAAPAAAATGSFINDWVRGLG